jgi:hypothetical protein
VGLADPLKALIDAEIGDPDARRRAWLMPWAELDFKNFAEALPDEARARELLAAEKARFAVPEMKSPFPDVLSDGEFCLFAVVWYNADAEKAALGLSRWPGPSLKERTTIAFLRAERRRWWRRNDLAAKRAAWDAQWQIINPPFR